MKRRLKNILTNCLHFWFSNKLIVRTRNLIEQERIRYQHDLIKSKVASMGAFSRFAGKVSISGADNIIIGNNVHIGDGAFLDGRGGILIGDNTHISRNFTLYTSNHYYEGKNLPYDRRLITKEVFIGRNVWIGMDVCITPGTHIGDGAIIGMGSVISKDVDPGDIVVSGHQRVIGKRNMEIYKYNEEKRNYGGREGKDINQEMLNAYLISPLKAKQVIFVVSAGLSGEESLIHVLKQNSHVSIFNDTFNTMWERISLEYLTGKITIEKVKERVLSYFNRINCIHREAIYIEVNPKLAPFIGVLNEVFHKPQFIWLIRHPKYFMHAIVSRNWFKTNDPVFFNDRAIIDPKTPTHDTLISGFLAKEYSKDEWNSLDQRTKALWYWRFWNTLINQEIQSVPTNQRITLKFENLNQEQNEIQNFLNIEDKSRVELGKLRTGEGIQRLNKDKKNNFLFFDSEGYKMVKEEMELFGYL